MYLILKNVHLFAVVLSALLFLLRYILIATRPVMALPKPLRVIPHINDTVLLLAAIGLLIYLDLNPFHTEWLLAKTIALLAYIALGATCFRLPPGSAAQFFCFVAATATFSYIVVTALRKQPIWF